MLFAVFVAICAAGADPRACTQKTAAAWIASPEPQQGLAACMIHGQEYAAGSRLMRPGDMVKVYCQAMPTRPVA